jgi:hypothetical protein
MTKDEALKLALEMVQTKMYAHAEMYLKEALAQPAPVPEPVGMRWRWPGYAWVYTEEIRSDLAGNPENELLYTTPPAAQPEQEPIGYAVPTFDFDNSVIKKVHYAGTVPLYTTPPQRTWVGLMEDEAFACKGRDYFETYKAIEAKLRSKNENL